MTIDACLRGETKKTGLIDEAIRELSSHSIHVGLLTTALASELGMAQDEADHLGVCAVFHDVGKLYIPAEILQKPGRLTAEEYSIIKEHPLIGAEKLIRVFEHDSLVSRIAIQHHERYNQLGYPLQISAAPVDSQIVAVCDCLEAMTAHRSYKKAMDFQTAYNLVSREACGQFHPTVMKGLCSDDVFNKLEAVNSGKELPTEVWLQKLAEYKSIFKKHIKEV